MAEASGRASRRGPENALFVVAAAEQLPQELRGVADELTVLFPWSSLLRGALALDGAAADGIASLLAPAGVATAIVSIEDHDGLELPRLDAAGLGDRWRAHGLEVCELRRATADEIRSTGSTWARRLRADSQRTVWRIELERRPADPDGLGHS
jgi:16S rRNA (adenine(1408)-N(1))-methyltransferase